MRSTSPSRRLLMAMGACVALVFGEALADGPTASPSDGKDGAFFYVAPDGDDAQLGTKEKPFRTVEAARDAIRRLKAAQGYPKGGATVLLRGGVYERGRTFELGPEDSGTADAPVVYAAAEGEAPRLVGGARIPAKSFVKVTDPGVLARLVDPAAARHLLQVDLKARGITDYGEVREEHVCDFGSDTHYLPAPLELFVDGEAMTLARYPNRNDYLPQLGFIDRARQIQATDAEGKPVSYAELAFRGVPPADRADGDVPALAPVLAAGHMTRWGGAGDAMVSGGLIRGFAQTSRAVKSVDPAAVKVALKTPVVLAKGYDQKEATLLFFFNLLEEIDVPGEYYLDRAKGILYLYPPPGFGPESEAVVSLLAAPLVAVEGAKHVRLRGLTLEATRTTGVTMSGGEDNVVERCEIRNTGIVGVQIGRGYDSAKRELIDRLPGEYRHALSTGMERGPGGPIIDARMGDHPRGGTALDREAGTGNGVDGCVIHHTGKGGVLLGGGDRKTLTPGGNFVRNCNIYRTDRLHLFYSESVVVDGCGNRIEGNYLHDNYGGLLYLQGNDHVVESNEICRGAEAVLDGGAVEIRQNPSQLGNKIRGNFIHHNGRNFNSQTLVVYLDNESCGVEISGNVFYRNYGRMPLLYPDAGGPIKVNGGYLHVVTNNLFVDNNGVSLLDGADLAATRSRYAARKFMMEQDVDVTAPPYSVRYPEFAKLYAGITAGDPSVELANKVFCNAFVGNLGALTPSRYPDRPLRHDNLVLPPGADPGFVDEDSGDLTLRRDSVIFRELPGFQPIPFEKMRQSLRWPDPEDRRRDEFFRVRNGDLRPVGQAGKGRQP